jgi:glycosyltransferase involved in cell wall biosynthesis
MIRRIALVSEHASPVSLLGSVDSGGQNVYVGQLASHLSALGHEVDVFTRRDDGRLPQVASLAPRLRLVHVPAGPPVPIRKEALLPYMGAFADFVRRVWRRRRYDLVHANFFMSGLVAAEVKAALGVPFVVTFHALGRVRRLHQQTADGFPDERFAIEDRIVREADRIVAECPQDAEDLERLYGAPPARLETIPCGVDPDEFYPMSRREARAMLGLPDDKPIILQLGRMVPRKGVDTVIRAMSRLRARGVAARLVVVGGESDTADPALTPEIGRLLRIAAEEGVAADVTFTGRRPPDRLRLYYAAADVFATVPWYEPFGITPLEAMACARPVVGAAVGGIRHTVVDGVTGYLVPPKDADALADRLARLCCDPALGASMGRRGLARVRAHFTWRGVAERMARMYDLVLDDAGRLGDRTFPARRAARVASLLTGASGAEAPSPLRASDRARLVDGAMAVSADEPPAPLLDDGAPANP